MNVHSKQNEDGTVEAWFDIGPHAGRMTSEELRSVAKIPENWEQIDFTANKWDALRMQDRGVVSLWQAKGRYRPPRSDVAGLESLLSRLEGLGGVLPPITPALVPQRTGGVLLEIAPMDIHIGMYAWALHTGQPYDIDIASQLYLGAIKELIDRAQSFNPVKIVFVFGNDFLHIDSPASTTTGGTFMPETSGTFHEIASKGQETSIQAVEMCLKVCPVDVLVVGGNHDQSSAWFLGEVLKAWYRGNENVTVNNSPGLTKYYQWGSNLIGFNHGKLAAKEYRNLGLQMARDVPQLWAATKFQEWHLAHIHSSTNFEVKGIRIRHLPSLVPANNWHDDRNFRGQRRACEAYLWEYDSGYLGHLSVNIDPSTGELL